MADNDNFYKIVRNPANDAKYLYSADGKYHAIFYTDSSPVWIVNRKPCNLEYWKKKAPFTPIQQCEIILYYG